MTPNADETPLVDQLADRVSKTGGSRVKRKFFLIAAGLCAGLIVLMAIAVYPLLGRGRYLAQRSGCRSNLKELAFANWNYYDTSGQFPSAYGTQSGATQPVSWRVQVLPFVDEPILHARYDQTKPWHSPGNTRLQIERPSCFVCPSDDTIDKVQANYVAPLGPLGMWRRDEPSTEEQISDGTSNTVLLLERHENRPIWTEPFDAELGPDPSPTRLLSSSHVGGTQAAMVDGTVRFFSDSMDPVMLKAILTPAAGDNPGEF